MPRTVKHLLFLLMIIFLASSMVIGQDDSFLLSGQLDIHIADIEADLPSASMYISDIKQHVRYPEGWVVTRLLYPMDFSAFSDEERTTIEVPVFAFSPEPVSLETIRLFEAREPTPPILLVAKALPTRHHWEFYPSYFYLTHARTAIVERPSYNEWPNFNAFYLLVSDEEWELNQAMYQAMLEYPFTFQYYAHESLQNTLFTPTFHIGYPEGWVEAGHDESHYYFLPENETELSQAITFQFLKGFDTNPFGSAVEPKPILNKWLDEFLNKYHLLPEARPILEEATFGGCRLVTPPMPYVSRSERGYLRVYTRYIEVSASEEAPVTDEMLYAMAESFDMYWLNACG